VSGPPTLGGRAPLSGKFGGESQSGPRPYNEDRFLLRDLSAVAASIGGIEAFIMVADGMGGHESGDVASSVAVGAASAYVDRLVEAARIGSTAVDAAGMLSEIATAANLAVHEAAEGGEGSMGTTMVAAFASADRVWIAHVGDSRAYIVGTDSAEQVTTDHSAVGRMIRDGVLTELQAQEHPQRNVIEKALGFDGGDEPEIDERALRPGDVLLLCSDGLSTVLTAANLTETLASAPSLPAATRALVSDAIVQGTDDNTTCVVWSGTWKAAPYAALASSAARAMRRGSSRRARTGSGRRLPSRHNRAQRATLVIGGVLTLLLVVGLALAALGGPQGGAGGGVPTRATTPGKSSTSTSTVAPTTGARQPATGTTWEVDKSKGDGHPNIWPSAPRRKGTGEPLEDRQPLTVASQESTRVGKDIFWRMKTRDTTGWVNRIYLRKPSVGAKHVAALPDRLKTLDGARQVVIITAANKESRDGTLALYDLDNNGNWIERMSTPTRMGKNALVSGADRHQGSYMTPTGSWVMPDGAFGKAATKPSGSKPSLHWKQIVSSSYWSSEPGSTYNTWVNHESAGEHLIKYAGQSYKYAINSGYNSLPNTRIEGRGTAIFIHCMHAGYTAGCISIEESKMVELLQKLDPTKKPRCVIGTIDPGTSTSISKY